MELQTKLLRVIQDGEFERLGGPKTIKVKCGSSRPPTGSWRKRSGRAGSGDLFYRLNVFPITIPPLRQRKEDIPLLSIILSPNSTRKQERRSRRCRKTS